MNSEAEEIIQVYLEWLNSWIDHTNEFEETLIPPATRPMFDEFNDPPKIALDEVLFPDSIITRRYIVIITNPFHDEGGTTVLTAIFSHDDVGFKAWILDLVLMENDTLYQAIYNNGQLQRPS